jgi:hypothetical protein
MILNSCDVLLITWGEVLIPIFIAVLCAWTEQISAIRRVLLLRHPLYLLREINFIISVKHKIGISVSKKKEIKSHPKTAQESFVSAESHIFFKLG